MSAEKDDWTYRCKECGVCGYGPIEWHRDRCEARSVPALQAKVKELKAAYAALFGEHEGMATSLDLALSTGLAECDRLRDERDAARAECDAEVDRQVRDFCDEHNRQCAYDCARAEKLEAIFEAARAYAAEVKRGEGGERLIEDEDRRFIALREALAKVDA